MILAYAPFCNKMKSIELNMQIYKIRLQNQDWANMSVTCDYVLYQIWNLFKFKSNSTNKFACKASSYLKIFLILQLVILLLLKGDLEHNVAIAF